MPEITPKEFKSDEELREALEEGKAAILAGLQREEEELGIEPFSIDEEELERLSKLSLIEIDRQVGQTEDDKEFGLIYSPSNSSPENE